MILTTIILLIIYTGFTTSPPHAANYCMYMIYYCMYMFNIMLYTYIYIYIYIVNIYIQYHTIVCICVLLYNRLAPRTSPRREPVIQ